MFQPTTLGTEDGWWTMKWMAWDCSAAGRAGASLSLMSFTIRARLVGSTCGGTHILAVPKWSIENEL